MLFNYFFLYPFGHTGLIAVTFFVILPFIHVIVVFFTTGAFVTDGVGVGVGVAVGSGVGVGVGVGVASTTSWNNLT